MVKVRALKNIVYNSLSAKVGTEFDADDALLQHLLTRKLVEVIAVPLLASKKAEIAKPEIPKPEPVKEVLKDEKVVKAFPKIVKTVKPKSVK